METYKNWKIETSEYIFGYFEAYNLNDCDDYVIFARSIEEVKTEIDEYEQERETTD